MGNFEVKMQQNCLNRDSLDYPDCPDFVFFLIPVILKSVKSWFRFLLSCLNPDSLDYPDYPDFVLFLIPVILKSVIIPV